MQLPRSSSDKHPHGGGSSSSSGRAIQRIVWFVCLTLCPALSAQPSLDKPPDLPPPPPPPPGLVFSEPPPPPTNLPDESELRSQLMQLEALLSLPPDRLKRMRETIEMIERMSPSQRESLRLRLQHFKEITPELEKEIEELAKLLPDAQRKLFREYWISLRPDDRQSAREHLASVAPPQRADWIQGEMQAFKQHRQQVFESMQAELEERRREALAKSADGAQEPDRSAEREEPKSPPSPE